MGVHSPQAAKEETRTETGDDRADEGREAWAIAGAMARAEAVVVVVVRRRGGEARERVLAGETVQRMLGRQCWPFEEPLR